MGLMLDGVWRDVPRETKSTGGEFIRPDSGFRDRVSAPASPAEADVRLFTTLVRFDAVYYSHLKCNLRRLSDYPRLWRYARRIYALPGVARTVLDFSL